MLICSGYIVNFIFFLTNKCTKTKQSNKFGIGYTTKMIKHNIILLFTIFFSLLSSSTSQQPYERNNPQLRCDVAGVSTAGYTCNLSNSDPQTCNSFLSFRSQTNYQTPLQISDLLNSNPSSIAKLNEAHSNNSAIPFDNIVLIPTSCNCSSGFYQHNANYVVHIQGETYLTIANYTYQGLTTCQALISQNKIKERQIFAGDNILVPLRCACPTKNQTELGFKFLLTYIITWKDNVYDISQKFGADFKTVLAANELSDSDIINPFTTLLIPLKKEPTIAHLSTPPLSAPSPSDTAADTPPPSGGSSSKKWVAIGVAIGAVFLVLLALTSWYCCCFKPKRARKMHGELPIDIGSKQAKDDSTKYGTSSSFVSSEARNFIESLTVYKFGELEKATNYFGEESRIKGSVYQAVINKDKAAVKRLKGDVSNEIKILKQINHSNIIRLSGFCVHEGDTYFVYEFAENGSLADWIHVKKDLSWKQRVMVAYDVADGLNYLHNYTNPPYIHKNLKSSNILMDSEFRGKIANFGLARKFEEYEEMAQLTRHVVGTQGYLAPEYLEHGLITPKLDVFAFGVVLLELLSGKEATYKKDDEDKEVMLWVEIGKVMNGEDKRGGLKGFMDPCLENGYSLDLAFAMAELAGRCVGKEAGSRPAMAEVFMSLSAIYNSTLEWDPSDVGNSGSMIHGR